MTFPDSASARVGSGRAGGKKEGKPKGALGARRRDGSCACVRDCCLAARHFTTQPRSLDSVVSSHTAVTPSPLTSPKHKFITEELQLSFLSVSHTLTMFLSLSCGWATCGLPIPLWFSCSSHAGLTTRLHPIGARRSLAFALMKRETRGSP